MNKAALALGIIILLADLAWLSTSLMGIGMSGAYMQHGNFTRPAGNFSAAGYATTTRGYGSGVTRYLGTACGVVILLADIAWLFVDSRAKSQTTRKR